MNDAIYGDMIAVETCRKRRWGKTTNGITCSNFSRTTTGNYYNSLAEQQTSGWALAFFHIAMEESSEDANLFIYFFLLSPSNQFQLRHDLLVVGFFSFIKINSYNFLMISCCQRFLFFLSFFLSFILSFCRFQISAALQIKEFNPAS